MLERLDQRSGPARHRQHERQAGPRDGGAGQATRQRLSCPAPRPRCTATPSSSPATTASSPSNPPSSASSVYSEALDQLSRLHALVKQGRAYLQRRLDDPELKPETDSGIAAWLGHAWQLRELKDAGLVETDAELVQLAFNSHDDVARQEYVDTGVWMTLGNGHIRLTQTFRPYKAAKFIKSDDSFFQVAQVKELCVYPGDVNPRVRWEAMLPRPLEPKDFAKIRTLGQADFAAVVKEVKESSQGAAGRQAADLRAQLQTARPRRTTLFVAEDAKGERLAMTDAGMAEEPPSCHLLSLLPKDSFEGHTLIARFRHDLDTRKLRSQAAEHRHASGDHSVDVVSAACGVALGASLRRKRQWSIDHEHRRSHPGLR